MHLQPGQPLDVPVEEGDIGGVYVNVAFLKDDRFYRAEKRLDVSNLDARAPGVDPRPTAP